jgi:predicted TPR repeat methyltransferase
VLVELRAWKAGIAALTQAIARAPNHPDFYFYLGVAYFNDGDLAGAELAFSKAVVLKPDHAEALHNLGGVRVADGRPQEARVAFRAAIAQDPDFAQPWVGLADACRADGDTAGVIAALTEAVKRDPQNPHARHLLAAARGESPVPDWRYVTELFEGYAARFEAHLTGPLHYVGHQELAALLRETIPGPTVFRRWLDLGCGTGLVATALLPGREIADRIGVDLAAGMVAAAKARGLYTEVVKAEANAFLADGSDLFDLITAADTFGYMGDLAPVFAGCARRLSSGSALAFMVKPKDGEGFALDPQGYYVHAESHVLAAAAGAGLAVKARREAPFRKHDGRAQSALYMVMVRKL